MQPASTFHHAYPAIDLAELEALRTREYARLDDQSLVYLDYTGAGLYAASQLREHVALLNECVLGNPHSTNPTSHAATEFAERARARVLDFFNASPSEYVVIFTANATGALKLVGEAYPFGPNEPVCAHGRQPQLRQRHPRICAHQRRAHDLHSCASARPAGGYRRAARRARLHHRARLSVAVRVSGPVEPVGCAAPPRMDRLGKRARLGRARRRGSIRTHQSARPQPLATRFRADFLLQAFWLSHRHWLPDRAPRGARTLAAPVVLGWHD